MPSCVSERTDKPVRRDKNEKNRYRMHRETAIVVAGGGRGASNVLERHGGDERVGSSMAEGLSVFEYPTPAFGPLLTNA